MVSILKQLAFSLLNPFFNRAIFFVYQLSTYIMNCIDDHMYNIFSFFTLLKHTLHTVAIVSILEACFENSKKVCLSIMECKKRIGECGVRMKVLNSFNNLEHCIQYVYATFRIFFMKCECFKVGICTM